MSKNINTLSSGALVGLLEDGNLVPYIYLQSNHYGNSEACLIRKYCYPAGNAYMFREGDTSQNAYNCYNNSKMDQMCTAHKAKLSAAVQAQLQNVSIPVAQGRTTTGGSVSSTIITLSRSVFLPSMTEYGLSGWQTEGSVITGLNANRIGYQEGAITTALNVWSRSPFSVGYSAYFVYVDGNARSNYVWNSYAFRPALTLKSGILVSDSVNSDGMYTLEIEKPIVGVPLWVKKNGIWYKTKA